MKVRRVVRWGVAGGVLAVATVGAVSWWRGPAVPVVRAVRRELVQTVVASGRVETPARIRLGSQVLGTIERMNVDAGDTVQQGQVLVELDDSETRAAVAEARAAILEATARLGQVRTTGAVLAAEDVRQAEVELERAQADADRQERLLGSGTTTRAAAEEARRAVALATSRRASALVRAAETASAGGERRVAAAAIRRAEAALSLAEARLELTRIRAPANGVVLARRAEPGDVAVAGGVLLEIARSGPTRLVVAPDERSLALLRTGQRAVASAEAFPDKSFDAIVSFIAPSVDPERGTVEVQLDVPRPPPHLRPDMTVSVDVEVARRRRALVLPTEAIRDAFSEEPWVYTVEDGRVHRRPLRLGARGEGTVEIVRGLSPGAAVILGTERYPIGRRVRARDAGGA